MQIGTYKSYSGRCYHTKAQLVEGIQAFWATVSSEKYTTYILHLNKVLPKLIEMKGEATGY